jgi:hypothetical protein
VVVDCGYLDEPQSAREWLRHESPLEDDGCIILEFKKWVTNPSYHQLDDPINLEIIFRELSDRWYEETGHRSIVMEKLNHPAYNQIIDLGVDVVPFILREIENDEGHWFLALEEITGEDPAPENADLDESIDAWLDWGRKNKRI